MAITSRPYETDTDLRRMQSLQQELWSLEGERTHTHIGDLAWWSTMHVGREGEWKRRLWLDGERCVAWAWLDRPASLDYEVHRDHRGCALHEELLDWFEAEAENGGLQAWAMDGDDASLELLVRRGFAQPDPHKWYAYYVQDLEQHRGLATDCCKVPKGFRLRTVRGDDDLHERVEVHRAAWEPSRLTEESYRNVMRIWPYRPDLDCVLEAPDGTFAAYVLCWYDDVNRVGEFEPVGTHPGYRRRGLGAAVCAYALQRLREEGAEKAIVYAGGRDEDLRARALYESIGFRRHTRMTELRKER
jgi:ribosomal protein S18 acetylase RimI-like enzyme